MKRHESIGSSVPRSQTARPSATLPRVLLTSVFGPYGQDDEYGSRRLNPMELFHNQVTRTQGGSRCGCSTVAGA
jgi:hypothetical protein